jgi:N-acetyl-anhydromuramyl-L-alanine amidase AmpD
MKLLTEVKFIVIHCADSKSDMDVTVDTLRQWHVNENGWSDIGYHFFIKFDGTVHQCRGEQYQGAHCKSVNSKSIAICIEGGFGGVDNFTSRQKNALFGLISEKKAIHKNAVVTGHNHFDEKACPSFNVVEWYDKENEFLSKAY